MELSATFASLVPIVLALTEGIKRLGISTKWAPVVSIILGLVGVWTLNGQEVDILSGVIVGLTASGLWSSSKSIKNTIVG